MRDFPSLDGVYVVLLSFIFLICHLPFYPMLIVNFRDKILCDLWTWCAIHGATAKGNIRALHWLRVEEPLLWNGNANSVRVVWSQPCPGCAKGPDCTFGPLNLICYSLLLLVHCFLKIRFPCLCRNKNWFHEWADIYIYFLFISYLLLFFL